MRTTLPASLVASGHYEEFAQGPGKRHGRSNSLKWPWLYDKLRAKGYDKSKAAAISNSRIHMRKRGRISVLDAKTAHKASTLRKIATADRTGKHFTKANLRASAHVASIAFACNDRSCAPPPTGTGGSIQSGKSVRGLSVPDSGFTLSTKLRPLRSGFAVALSGSDRLVTANDAFDSTGKPSAKLVGLVRERISAAIKSAHPAGTKLALGGWHNPEDGKIEINVTVVFPKNKKAEALNFAKQQDQIALFSLHQGDVIMTGGTGGNRDTN